MRWGIIFLFLISLINIVNAQVTCEKYIGRDSRGSYKIFENGVLVPYNSSKHEKYYEEICQNKLQEVKQATVKADSSCPWYKAASCSSTAGFKRVMGSQNLRSNYVAALSSEDPQTLEELLNFQIPKIDDECPVNNFCSQNNTCQPKICENGAQLLDGYCVINILEDSNPCRDVAPNTVPYLTTMVAATPDMPRDSSGKVCLVPNNLRAFYQAIGITYASDVMSYSPGNSGGFNPTLSFVGCKYNQGRSKAVYKLSSGPASNPVYAKNSYSSAIAMYCADGNVTSRANDTYVAQISSFLGVPDDGYIMINASNYCYRYKPLLMDGWTKSDLPELVIPYVSCEECGTGLMKINGECTCPSDMDNINGVCKKKIGCETATDFYNGLCQCGGANPYKVAGSIYPVGSTFAGEVYTCKQPQYPRSAEVTKGSSISGSVSSNGCSVESGRPTFNYTINVSGTSSTHGYTVGINVRCADLDFRERRQDDFNDWYGSTGTGGTGGSIGTVSVAAGASETFTYSIKPDGTCYKYKFYAVDYYTYQWEQDVTITYPFCK